MIQKPLAQLKILVTQKDTSVTDEGLQLLCGADYKSANCITSCILLELELLCAIADCNRKLSHFILNHMKLFGKPPRTVISSDLCNICEKANGEKVLFYTHT